MAEGKKSFVAYCDWLEIFETMPDEKAGKLVKHLFKYVNDQDPEIDDELVKMAFISIKQTLKRDLQRWEQFLEKQRLNGMKGGRPNAQPNPTKPKPILANPTKPKKPKPILANPTEPKKAVSVSVSVNDSVSVSDIDNEKEKTIGVPFESFWNLYEKKVDRPKCEKKWNALKDTERVAIMAFIPDYIKAQPDKQYRKDPATFLNNRSWENEIVVNSKNSFPDHWDSDWLRGKDSETYTRYVQHLVSKGFIKVSAPGRPDKYVKKFNQKEA